MSLVEVVLFIANRPDAEMRVFSEQALRNAADNKVTFYDEERRALVWRGYAEKMNTVLPLPKEPVREYEHTCCKCGKKFTAPHPPSGLSFCGYGCT